MMYSKKDLITFLTRDRPYLLGLLVLYSYMVLSMWIENIARQDPWTDIFKNCVVQLLPLILIQLLFHGLLHLNKSWWKKVTRVSVRFYFGFSLVVCSIVMFPFVLLAEYWIGEGPGELFDLSWNDFPFFLTVSRPVAIWLFWWLILVEQKQLAQAQYRNMQQQIKYQGYALLYHRLHFLVQYFVKALEAIQHTLQIESNKVLTLIPEVAQIFRNYLLQPARLFNSASEAISQLQVQLGFNHSLFAGKPFRLFTQIDPDMQVPAVILPGFIEQILLLLMNFNVKDIQLSIVGFSKFRDDSLTIELSGCNDPQLYSHIINRLKVWTADLPANMLVGLPYQMEQKADFLSFSFTWPANQGGAAEEAEVPL